MGSNLIGSFQTRVNLYNPLGWRVTLPARIRARRRLLLTVAR